MGEKVTLGMEGEYSSVSSGIVYFKNIETGAEFNIRAPDDLKTLTYGISSIIIAHLSERCHDAKAKGDEETLAALESEIDQAAAQLWGITDDELKAIQS